MTTEMQASDVAEQVREAFNFGVQKLPLSGPDNLSTVRHEGGEPLYGLFRDDTGTLVGNGSVTARYVPHTTDQVCDLVEAASEAFDGSISCRTHFQNGHYVEITPTKAERLAVFGEHDNAWPRVMVRAGFDGKAFAATMGYYRDACQNLAMLRRVSGTTVNIRHTKGLLPNVDELIKKFESLKNSWVTMSDLIEDLATREVRMVEFLDQIYGSPSDAQLEAVAQGSKIRAVTTHKNRKEAIWNRLSRERAETGRPQMVEDRVSAWEAFNAIQGYVQHDAQAKRGFTGEFHRILRASNDTAVKKAEEIVLALTA